MKPTHNNCVHKIINMTLIISLILISLSFVFMIGGGGVLNDHDQILNIIENEKYQDASRNLISPVMKEKLNYFRNSDNLKQYITDTEKLLKKVKSFFIFFSILFVVTFLTKIFIKVKKYYNDKFRRSKIIQC
ncbi:MAG: hypothetical protein ACRYGR_00820 [Janthinobacterium lividum]